MEKSYRKPALTTPLRIRLRRLFSIICSLAVLLAAAGVLIWLFDREDRVQFCGIVDSGAENICPLEAARIVSVEVVPGQPVKAGDVVVRFDSANRLMDEALTEMKIRDSENKVLDEERRCRQLVCEAEVELATRIMEQAREQAELAGDEAEVARLKPLVDRKIVSELELSALRPKIDCLRRSIAAYGPLFSTLSNRLEQARRDLAEASERARNRLDGDLRSADAALFGAFKRDPSVLRAASDGIVSQVFRRSGDIVPEGEPVVRLAGMPDARSVTGMLPTDRLDAVSVGDRVSVFRMVQTTISSNQTAIDGVVEAIDLEVLDLFDPNNPTPKTPVRGRKVRIRLLGDASRYIPGEPVVIALTDRGLMNGGLQ